MIVPRRSIAATKLIPAPSSGPHDQRGGTGHYDTPGGTLSCDSQGRLQVCRPEGLGSVPVKLPEGKCIIWRCDGEPWTPQGYCRMCWQELRKDGEHVFCAEDECRKYATRRGMCEPHCYLWYHRQRYVRNEKAREQAIARARKSDQDNPDRARARQRKYKSSPKGKAVANAAERRRRAENRDEINRKNREYRKRVREAAKCSA